ncbi:putative leader peptide [Streptomyces sp. NPDC092369]
MWRTVVRHSSDLNAFSWLSRRRHIDLQRFAGCLCRS